MCFSIGVEFCKRFDCDRTTKRCFRIKKMNIMPANHYGSQTCIEFWSYRNTIYIDEYVYFKVPGNRVGEFIFAAIQSFCYKPYGYRRTPLRIVLSGAIVYVSLLLDFKPKTLLRSHAPRWSCFFDVFPYGSIRVFESRKKLMHVSIFL